MKNKIAERRNPWKFASAALAGVLLTVGSGCILIRITITTPGPQQATTGPIVHGGIFVPVQAAPLGGTQATVCGNPVSTNYVRFTFTSDGQTLLTQTPPAGYTGFRGTVLDLYTGQTIPNTNYYLQWFVNALPQNNGCCTNVPGSGTDVGCRATAGQPYRFTAFFKIGYVPPSGDQIQLQGAWTQ